MCEEFVMVIIDRSLGWCDTGGDDDVVLDCESGVEASAAALTLRKTILRKLCDEGGTMLVLK